jgi:hypothetical protein
MAELGARDDFGFAGVKVVSDVGEAETGNAGL